MGSRACLRLFADYVVTGLREGFRIGFDRFCQLRSARTNLPTPQGGLVQEYLGREVSLERMVSYSSPLPDELHISPLGIIPKRHRPIKWRLIVDLSVNDGISPELASVQYSRIDHLAALVLLPGRGSALVKGDIKEAYHNVTVHPEDHSLLAVEWEGIAYMDQVLPFGLRSAPIIFLAAAGAVQWMLREQGISKSLHYLDDFILVEKAPRKQREDSASYSNG